MRRGFVVGALLVAAVTGVTSCTTSSPAEETGSRSTSTKQEPPPKPVQMVVTPADKAADVPPGSPITVAAVAGKVTEVILTNDAGEPVAGALSPDGSTWQATQPLAYGRTYSATATGVGTDDKPVTVTSTFTTATPRVKSDLSMSPLDGDTVGVGQPLAFYFEVPITDKVAAEQAIQITSTPAVEGAFYWFDDEQVHWRPKEYWPAGTKITISAEIYGKHFGDGVYGDDNRLANITVGDAITMVADGATHQMTVTVNGAVARTIPISMGKPGNETPAGTYVVMGEHTDYTMDSSTYGVPVDSGNGYRTHVDVASRMSNSGIFYHSAPWSVGDQGNQNVSHGCINMSTENARWLQELSRKGDVVVVQNSGGEPLPHWDGFGDWQIPWEVWQTGNR